MLHLVGKFDVGKSFRRSVEFVAEDGHAVDAAATVEVLLKLLGRRAVVNVTNVHRPEKSKKFQNFKIKNCSYNLTLHFQPDKL